VYYKELPKKEIINDFLSVSLKKSVISRRHFSLVNVLFFTMNQFIKHRQEKKKNFNGYSETKIRSAIYYILLVIFIEL